MPEKLLFDLLCQIKDNSSDNFSGIGIVISNSPNLLPLFPIRLNQSVKKEDDLVNFLCNLSQYTNKYHDGFHILSEKMEILQLSQYFSPPIVKTINIDRSKDFGGRYLAAIFGSTLPAVIATGIASHQFGIAIFNSGKETFHRKP